MGNKFYFLVCLFHSYMIAIIIIYILFLMNENRLHPPPTPILFSSQTHTRNYKTKLHLATFYGQGKKMSPPHHLATFYDQEKKMLLS